MWLVSMKMVYLRNVVIEYRGGVRVITGVVPVFQRGLFKMKYIYMTIY